MTCPRRVVALLATTTATLFVWAGAASAHEPSATLITVRQAVDGVDLDVRVPLDRAEIALDRPLADMAAVQSNAKVLRSWFQDDVTIVSPGGQSWDVTIGPLDTTVLQDVANLAVTLQARAPADVETDVFTLHYAVMLDELPAHRVYVAEPGSTGDGNARDARVLGLMMAQAPKIAVDLESGPASSATALLATGFTHFREGTDHLLFLCLVALGAARRSNGALAGLRGAGALTLAFSVGHSLSLGLSTIAGVSLPVPLVESAVAVTILAAAWHAWRPRLLPRVELVATTAFGLVHGLGFAGTLADLSVSGTGALVSLLAFNVGLELAQLAALALVSAPLFLLARSVMGCALILVPTAVIALVWLAERALGRADPTTAAVELVAATPERLALTLVVAAALATLVARSRNPRLSSDGPSAAVWRVDLHT